MSTALSLCRGPSSPSKAPVGLQLTSGCEEEEGPAETVKQGQADRFGLTDFKETLKALDDSSEIHWLTELLPLCLECQAFMSMGNQQGTKLKPNCHSNTETRDTSPKSPRLHIPRKRRRRADGLVSPSTLHHNFKMTPGALWIPPRARTLTKLRMTSSPTYEDWDFGAERAITCTPAARRKKATGTEREDISELKPLWRAKLPAAASENAPRSYSKCDLVFPGKDESAADSDTDLSEYDNEMFPQSSQDPLKSLITQSASEKHGEKKAEFGEVSFPRWWLEEFGERTAARRVMGKIEEVEGIIRRVSLTSSDWISEGGDELQSIPDGNVDEDELQVSTDSLVEELHLLGEALSQSLHQALMMEGGGRDISKAEIEAFTEDEQRMTLCEQSPSPLNLQSHPYHFIFSPSTLPNNSSPSPSAGGETSPIPSPSPSAILDASARTSSSFEGMSPNLSPSVTSTLSSPGPSHRSPCLPLNFTHQHYREEGEDVSRAHRVWTNSAEDSFFSQGAGGCGSAITVTGVTEKGQRNPKRKLTWANNRLAEQNQMQTNRCSNETEASHDYLLSSGKNCSLHHHKHSC